MIFHKISFDKRVLVKDNAYDTFPFDNLQLMEQIKPIKINDKVSISGIFINDDIDLFDIDFTLDNRRKYKTTKFLFYLTDVKKAK